MKSKLKIFVWIAALVLLWGSLAQAQTVLPANNAGFDITGFIQSASLNATPRGNNDPAMRGGVIWVNGRRIVVPDNSLVQFPASTWTWAQLFDPTAWVPVGYPAGSRPVPPAGRTGLALNDPITTHFPSFEVRVVGNIITDQASGVQNYVAALILPIVQQGLNGQSGYINFIDYDGSVLGIPGRFRVGGTMGDSLSGTLCELNDPNGRFGAEHSPDQRFKVDDGNPTVSAATGYPVGIPRVAPTGVAGFEGDPDRPYTNRPNNGTTRIFQMPASSGQGTTVPDPYRQVPLMLGDWVDVSGTWFLIDPAGRVSPANQFLSVHTLNAHLGIKTAPNTDPAYMKIEEFIFGVGDGNGGPTIAGIAQETSTRVTLVAFTTDTMLLANKAAYPASVYAIDKDPATGAETELLFPNGNGAANPDINIDDTNRGRVRWQLNKQPHAAPGLIANAAPLSLPAAQRKITREYVFRMNRLQATQGFPLPNMTTNNLPGLVVGQYRLPIFEYIFGEGTNFGEPWPPFNFQDLNFLVLGEGAVGPGGAVVGGLRPFPAFD